MSAPQSYTDIAAVSCLPHSVAAKFRHHYIHLSRLEDLALTTSKTVHTLLFVRQSITLFRC
ncbi:hypothetical protein HMPREF0972_00541 [Actinomyces sp. oral taxon 848 str. F0332]|nr:hypothetical protein HMPREF0972_00541 [Actinomyces sp. oral taxon 848 str. F0332]